MPKLKKTKAARRPAAALLLVIVSLGLLAFIVTELIAAGVQRYNWQAQQIEHDGLRREAFSALEATLGILGTFSRLDGTLYGPAQGWGEPLTLAEHTSSDGSTVSVTFRDESGYYGINTLAANTTQMRRFLQDFGIAESQAQTMADNLADWVDTRGAGRRLNSTNVANYPEGIAPPGRPLQRLDELRHVIGFGEVFFNDDGTGNELWERLVNCVSLVSTSTAPNINTAPESVLEVIASRHAFDIQSILAARDGTGSVAGTATVFRNTSDLSRYGVAPNAATDISFACTRLRIITRASRGDASVVIDTLLDTSATDGAFPFTIIQQRINALLQE